MKPQPRLTLIELFSIPGGGKTTLASTLSGVMRIRTRADLSTAWNAHSRLDKVRHIVRGLGDLRSVAPSAKLVLQAPLASPESLFRLGRMIAKTAWLRSQSGALLLDQGFIQDLWSILYSAGRMSPDPGLLSTMISGLYRGINAQILFIDIDPASAARRIANRGGGDSRLDGLPEEDVRKSLVQSAGIPDALIRAATAAGLGVRRIDGSQPPDALVRQLESLLREQSPVAGS